MPFLFEPFQAVRAAVWRIPSGEMVDAGGGSDFEYSLFRAVAGTSWSDLVAVGTGYQPYHSRTEAIVWDPVNGMRSLADVLTLAGADLSGWELVRATALVRADAAKVVGVGEGIHDGVWAPFLFELPVPQAPVADDGSDQTVHAGVAVTLDGSQSYDPGDAAASLLYDWQLVSAPTGSAAALSDPGAAKPTFVPDVPADYEFELKVTSAAGLVSAPDTVRVTATNQAPIANAGPDQVGITVGAKVTLDGTGSRDPDGDALTYAWSFVSLPAGSAAVLSAATSPAPTFVPDTLGDYVVQLVVSDVFGAQSAADTVTVTADHVPADVGEIVQQAGATIGALDPQSLRTPTRPRRSRTSSRPRSRRSTTGATRRRSTSFATTSSRRPTVAPRPASPTGRLDPQLPRSGDGLRDRDGGDRRARGHPRVPVTGLPRRWPRPAAARRVDLELIYRQIGRR